MKKIWLLLLLVLPLSVKAISAESAIVMDADAQRVLYCKNCNKEKLIASTTKIMTAIVALEYGNIDGNVEVGNEILNAYGSAIYVQLGETLTLRELLYGLMLRSGNDAAMVIAQAVTGSMESFVYLMNAKAESLGMTNTIFYNNHGLEENNGKGNTSTAKDMAVLMSYAMQNGTFREITSTEKITVKSNFKTYVWTNKNRLLSSYEYTTGGKTGYTDKARRTLVTSASKDGKNLVVVTLNDGNDFKDHQDLYEEYFEKYDLVMVLDKENLKIEEDLYKNEQLYIKNNFQMLVTDKEKGDLSIRVDLINKENVSDGEVVGSVKVLLGKDVVHEEDAFLKVKEKKSKSFWQKLWDFIKFW